MNSDLTSVRAKIARAEHHLRDIDTSLRLLIGDDPNAKHPVIFEHECDGKVLIAKLTECQPIDPALPLMIGDCLHNLRSGTRPLGLSARPEERSIQLFGRQDFLPGLFDEVRL